MANRIAALREFVNLVTRGPVLHSLGKKKKGGTNLVAVVRVSTSSLLGLYGGNIMLPVPINNGCESGIHRSRCRVVEKRRHMMAFCSSCA